MTTPDAGKLAKRLREKSAYYQFESEFTRLLESSADIIERMLSELDAAREENARLDISLSACDRENDDLASQRARWKDGYEAAMKENKRLREAVKSMMKGVDEFWVTTTEGADAMNAARAALSTDKNP